MFARFLATLFGTAKRTPIRTRLNAEALEVREVPALLTWTGWAEPVGGTPDTDFYLPDNWYPAQVPQAGDDLVFEWASPNPSSDKDCTNMGLVTGSVGGSGGGGPPTASSGHIRSLKILGGYSGTVTLSAEQEFDTFELKAPGAIAQPTVLVPTDITVTNKFTWTKGTLNSDTSGSGVVTLDGATGLIAPHAAGNVLTRDTMRFVGGAVATFLSGTVEIAGGQGLKIDEFSTVNFVAEALAPPVEIKATSIENEYLIESDGYIRVTGSAKSGLPVVLSGGELTISGNSWFTVKGELTNNVFGYNLPVGSVYQMGEAKTVIHAGSTLDTDNGMCVMGGRIIVRIPAGANNMISPTATIGGILSVTNADVRIEYDNVNQSGANGGLNVIGDVYWQSGRYGATINNSVLNERSYWTASKKFEIASSDACVVLVDRVNVGNAPPAGRWWKVIEGEGGMAGMLPTVADGKLKAHAVPAGIHLIAQ